MSDFLFELGCEELPAKILENLSQQLHQYGSELLKSQEINFDDIKIFATPRRLALLIHNIALQQPDRHIERKGPALKAAVDEHGNPTPAALGFARSCGVEFSELSKVETAEGAWLCYRQQQSGKKTRELLPEILATIFKKLSIKKTMRWGNDTVTFSRPVQWLVALLDNDIIPLKLFNLNSDRVTYGHRFLAPAALILKQAQDYEQVLAQQGQVIADLNQRRTLIKQQITAIAEQQHAHVHIDESLLDEVSNLVEWPCALLASFDKKFLAIPPEALITSMREHQKCFALLDQQNHLLPYFITVSNINSREPQQVIAGNQRVMSARLADADFFYHTDQQQALINRIDNLKNITFQQELGSLFAKTERIGVLASLIAEKLSADIALTQRAALLIKADLTTSMVGEFPELQGVMGYYYAQHHAEDPLVCLSIKEHYYPRFAGDELPTQPISYAVAISDRLDTLLGIIGTKGLPASDKDPFALRRAAYGVLRILIEKKLNLDLKELLVYLQQHAFNSIQLNQAAIEDVLQFFNQRQRVWYKEHGINADVIQAVMSQSLFNPYDIDLRLQAMAQFQQQPAAISLAAAHKRVHNILTKQAQHYGQCDLNSTLCQMSEEIHLVSAMQNLQQHLQPLLALQDYVGILNQLATLKEPVDAFFDKVMVLVEDEALRKNRLAILQQLHLLFSTVANLAELQG
ncbi:MAG: glycine--tRNA ligase subunit beta [Legionellales bacterium]|nr:glycine--tRNA ligase subunit beta [Legionellales bacterium]